MAGANEFFRYIGDAIADARHKMIDESWFGRRSSVVNDPIYPFPSESSPDLGWIHWKNSNADRSDSERMLEPTHHRDEPSDHDRGMDR